MPVQLVLTSLHVEGAPDDDYTVKGLPKGSLVTASMKIVTPEKDPIVTEVTATFRFRELPNLPVQSYERLLARHLGHSIAEWMQETATGAD